MCNGRDEHAANEKFPILNNSLRKARSVRHTRKSRFAFLSFQIFFYRPATYSFANLLE